MTTSASISGWKFYLGTTASPAVMNALEEVINVTGVGRTNALVDATNFDSPSGTKEFIGGLAEGDEITVTCNWYRTATQQLALKAAVEARSTRTFRLAYVNSSPEYRLKFDAVCLGWRVLPGNTDINKIEFRLKISGSVV